MQAPTDPPHLLRAAPPAVGKRGYWLGLAILGVGTVLAVMQIMGISRRVGAMHRVQMPATVAVTLDAGDNAFYSELESVVDGKVLRFASPTFECGFSGAGVTAERPSSTASYTFGGYSGRTAFVATAASPGEHSLTCTGDPFVLAWGANLGGAIIAVVGSVLIPFFMGVGVIAVTWRRRRRAARVAVVGGPPPTAL